MKSIVDDFFIIIYKAMSLVLLITIKSTYKYHRIRKVMSNYCTFFCKNIQYFFKKPYNINSTTTSCDIIYICTQHSMHIHISMSLYSYYELNTSISTKVCVLGIAINSTGKTTFLCWLCQIFIIKTSV